MAQSYEVVLYDGYAVYPAYYLIDMIEGELNEKDFNDKLADIVQEIRRKFKFDEEIEDRKIYENLYLLKDDGIIPARSVI